MSLTYYFYSIGVIPIFTSRAFLPIFATALTARFGHNISLVSTVLGVKLLTFLPSWATSNETLYILGAMAFIEVVLDKIPEAPNGIIGAKFKGICGFLTCFLLVKGDPMELVTIFYQILQGGSAGSNFDTFITALTSFYSGQSLAYTWSFFVGCTIWVTARFRRIVFGFLSDIDEDDNLGLQKILSWMEDGIGFIGVVFVVIAPFFALMVTLLAILALYLVKRYIEANEEKKKTPCSSCNAMNHPCATSCPSCENSLKNVSQVGLLGTVSKGIVTDNEKHMFHMLTWKRCYSCGTRFKQKSVNQECSVCAKKPFMDVNAVDAYLDKIRSRLPKTLGICFGLGLIPILGLIPGILYYKLSLVSGLRGYIPASKNILIRWGLRIFNFFLICLQPIPVIGSVTLPILCYANHSVYQGAVRKMSKRVFI